MHKLNLVSLFLAVLVVLALVACSPATPAATDVSLDSTAEAPAGVTPLPTLTNDYIGGGVLYDDWMHALGADVPEGDQALWKTQTTNTRTGKDTYRCKECHGWDYKGVDGAYGSGSHLTGFKGVIAASSMSEEDLLAWLDGSKNADHDYSVFLQDVELKMLVDFLKKEYLILLPSTLIPIRPLTVPTSNMARHSSMVFARFAIQKMARNSTLAMRASLNMSAQLPKTIRGNFGTR